MPIVQVETVATARPDKWRRIVTPCKISRFPVYVTIKYSNGRLSITGVEGPYSDGNCYGSCGQITLNAGDAAYGWTPEDVNRLRQIWRRWHLNGMRAGSPAQERWLRDNGHRFPGYPVSHYDWACQELAKVGLHPDPSHCDYKYGSRWLFEDVPEDVLAWLYSLPEAEMAYPWGS